jgi:hypothetical protein
MSFGILKLIENGEISGSHGNKYEDGMLRRVVWYAIRAMMEAVSTSETSINIYQTTQGNIPEDSHLRSKCASVVERSEYCTDVSEEFSTSCFRVENPNW